jgi:hypothetical protein
MHKAIICIYVRDDTSYPKKNPLFALLRDREMLFKKSFVTNVIMQTTSRIMQLREKMKQHGISAYYVPNTDAHQVKQI